MEERELSRAVYPGSFDPPTNGHMDIISRASNLVDMLIVLVSVNPAKKSLFTPTERVDMLKKVIEENALENVDVVAYDGLLVDFCKKNGIDIIIRGLRGVTDFEYEFQMAFTNKSMYGGIETLFMPTTPQNFWISSSVTKEVAMFGGDYYKNMVPAKVALEIERKFGRHKEPDREDN
jgi:pantetheine-phosphate adenylyltransferase